jgi:hypothetical protein
LGDIYDTIEDEEHEIGLTVIQTTTPPFSMNGENSEKFFNELDDFIFNQFKEKVQIYYQICIFATLHKIYPTVGNKCSL